MMTRARAMLLAVAAVSLGGCYAYTEPVGYAEVTMAPVGIEAAPYTYYEGRPVYWYRERWYYREGPEWRYYVQEPPELHRRRPYVQQAPPAPRYAPGYAPGYPPPRPPPAPAPAPAPAPRAAPPATKVQ